MTAFVCETCGVQFAPVPASPDMPPEACPICVDERQYVGHKGQRWVTNPDGLHKSGRRNVITELEPNLWGIDTTPSFGIGQRGLLIRTPAGNILWESGSLVDEESVEAVRALGGIAMISASHPHLVGSMVEWSHRFGNAPIVLHGADREWTMRPDPVIRYWDGDTHDPFPGSGLTLIRVGGHFPGAQVLLWPSGADGRGALFCGDVPQVAADKQWVSFLYSYPNMIPLSAAEVRRIATTLAGYQFDRIYGSWSYRVVDSDGSGVVSRSAERYIAHVR